MPFVTPLTQYTPETEIDQRSVADSKVLKKPAKIREEAENRNKQLLEGAFHGTLHLCVSISLWFLRTVRRPFVHLNFFVVQVDYAGEHKYASESKFRLSERRDELKALITR